MSEQWLRRLQADPIPWLLESTPWVRYRTQLDLLALSPNSSAVHSARAELLSDPAIQTLSTETGDWLPQAATRNSDPKLSYFKLRMLADFGLNKRDKAIAEIIPETMQHIEDGFFAVRGTHPKRLKKGEKYEKLDPNADIWHAAPCNSPMISYVLLALGEKNSALSKTVKLLAEHWAEPTGWFCHYFFVNSQFKKLQVGCPMAGMMALEVFSLLPDLKESQVAHNAFAPIKFHWEYGKTLYYFGRSKKFWSFKYPFVWYNALYLAEILTRFDFLKGDPLVAELISWIELSQDQSGRFKPTSIFMPYKSWDFGNKKESSPWITFLCCRILKRWYGS